MTNVETQPTGESATAVPAPHIATPLAGELALAIADLGSRHSRLSTLTKAIAELLLDALDLEVVAFFWCRTSERQAGRTRQLLQSTALVTRRTVNGEELSNRAKLLAYRAVARSASAARTLHTSAAGPLTALAVPIGAATPWAVLLVAYRPVPEEGETRQQTVLRLATSLATATRTAHVLDESAHGEHPHSQRRAIFTTSSEAILTIGEDLTIQEANPAFARVTGWTEQSVVGRPCSQVIRCRDERKLALCDTAACPVRLAFAVDSGAVTRDLSWQTQTGRLCDVSASFTAQRSGAEQRAVVVARDVAPLHAANRMRANFISMVSHELRTPLNTINGFLEIVLDGQVGPLNERQCEFLGYAHISTQQLTTLVEDILLISKADSGQFTLRTEVMDLSHVVTQAIQAVQPSADKAEVTVSAHVPAELPPTRVDELRIQQVLTNLLGNAIKFTPAGGSVQVSAEAETTELRFSVTDTGRGVAPEDQARIFERFYQSESTTRQRTGGYGLGLAIAKLIVEQHGGRIWVESEPGQGAQFSFALPLESAAD
jgi:two-component system phosphate regulon sensor histidine kinase PhoR